MYVQYIQYTVYSILRYTVYCIHLYTCICACRCMVYCCVVHLYVYCVISMLKGFVAEAAHEQWTAALNSTKSYFSIVASWWSRPGWASQKTLPVENLTMLVFQSALTRTCAKKLCWAAPRCPKLSCKCVEDIWIILLDTVESILIWVSASLAWLNCWGWLRPHPKASRHGGQCQCASHHCKSF